MRTWSLGRRLMGVLGIVLLAHSVSQFSLSPSWWYGLGLALGVSVIVMAMLPRAWQ